MPVGMPRRRPTEAELMKKANDIIGRAKKPGSPKEVKELRWAFDFTRGKPIK